MEWFSPAGPRNIVGAWILAAALIFGLFAASQFESDGPDRAQWAAQTRTASKATRPVRRRQGVALVVWRPRMVGSLRDRAEAQ